MTVCRQKNSFMPQSFLFNSYSTPWSFSSCFLNGSLTIKCIYWHNLVLSCQPVCTATPVCSRPSPRWTAWSSPRSVRLASAACRASRWGDGVRDTPWCALFVRGRVYFRKRRLFSDDLEHDVHKLTDGASECRSFSEIRLEIQSQQRPLDLYAALLCILGKNTSADNRSKHFRV